MVDESSLASTRQMREFLDRLGPHDRVLLIGDTRQHQGVDAGKPFEQLQEAGMRTAQLDQIMRQKDPELLKAVEHLSRNETQTGISMLQSQGRITELSNPQERIEAIAKDYAANPEKHLDRLPGQRIPARDQSGRENGVASQWSTRERERPFSRSRGSKRNERRGSSMGREIQARRYRLQYMRGSKQVGVEKNSYATVIATDPKSNLLTVERADGEHVSYDPKRLRGVNVYTDIAREFSSGDRIQFTQNNKNLDVHNRDLGRIEAIGKDNLLTVTMDDGKTINFDPAKMRHFDHGYAVTSHSSQGLTENRVIVNMDTNAPAELINTRFAYVSVSRASAGRPHLYQRRRRAGRTPQHRRDEDLRRGLSAVGRAFTAPTAKGAHHATAE